MLVVLPSRNTLVLCAPGGLESYTTAATNTKSKLMILLVEKNINIWLKDCDPLLPVFSGYDTLPNSFEINLARAKW